MPFLELSIAFVVLLLICIYCLLIGPCTMAFYEWWRARRSRDDFVVLEER